MPKSNLRIGYMPITDHLILGVSYALDNARFEHLALHPVKFHSWHELSTALESNKIDGGFILAPLALKLASGHTQVKTLLLSNREGSVFVVRKDIASIQNLKGKIIAVPHRLSTHSILLHKLITHEGMNYAKDISVVELDPSDMVAALSRGKIDGYIVAEPFGSQAEEQQIGKVLLSSKQIKEHHICCVLVIKEDVLKFHPPAIQEFINSLVMAGEYIHKHPEKASKIGSYFLGQTQSTIHCTLTKERVTLWDLLPLQEDFTEIQNYLTQVMKQPLKRIHLGDFVDTTYAQRAYEYVMAISAKKEKKTDRIEKIVLPSIILLSFIVVWHLIAASGLFLSSLLPSPFDVLKAIYELYTSGVLIQNIVASLKRVFAGFILAALFAIPLGLIVGYHKKTEYAIDPLIQVVRTISPIAWIPLAILWFGIGDVPAIFIIFITSLFPILIATIHSIKKIDPLLIKAAVNFGSHGHHMLRKVIFPTTFPYIVIGLRIALGVAWVVIVAAEMVGMRSGLGFMILDARNFLRTDMIIAGMIIIGLIGFAIDRVMSMIEKKIETDRALFKKISA